MCGTPASRAWRRAKFTDGRLICQKPRVDARGFFLPGRAEPEVKREFQSLCEIGHLCAQFRQQTTVSRPLHLSATTVNRPYSPQAGQLA